MQRVEETEPYRSTHEEPGINLTVPPSQRTTLDKVDHLLRRLRALELEMERMESDGDSGRFSVENAGMQGGASRRVMEGQPIAPGSSNAHDYSTSLTSSLISSRLSMGAESAWQHSKPRGESWGNTTRARHMTPRLPVEVPTSVPVGLKKSPEGVHGAARTWPKAGTAGHRDGHQHPGGPGREREREAVQQQSPSLARRQRETTQEICYLNPLVPLEVGRDWVNESPRHDARDIARPLWTPLEQVVSGGQWSTISQLPLGPGTLECEGRQAGLPTVDLPPQLPVGARIENIARPPPVHQSISPCRHPSSCDLSCYEGDAFRSMSSQMLAVLLQQCHDSIELSPSPLVDIAPRDTTLSMSAGPLSGGLVDGPQTMSCTPSTSHRPRGFCQGDDISIQSSSTGGVDQLLERSGSAPVGPSPCQLHADETVEDEDNVDIIVMRPTAPRSLRPSSPIILTRPYLIGPGSPLAKSPTHTQDRTASSLMGHSPAIAAPPAVEHQENQEAHGQLPGLGLHSGTRDLGETRIASLPGNYWKGDTNPWGRGCQWSAVESDAFKTTSQQLLDRFDSVSDCVGRVPWSSSLEAAASVAEAMCAGPARLEEGGHAQKLEEAEDTLTSLGATGGFPLVGSSIPNSAGASHLVDGCHDEEERQLHQDRIPLPLEAVVHTKGLDRAWSTIRGHMISPCHVCDHLERSDDRRAEWWILEEDHVGCEQPQDHLDQANEELKDIALRGSPARWHQVHHHPEMVCLAGHDTWAQQVDTSPRTRNNRDQTDKTEGEVVRTRALDLVVQVVALKGALNQVEETALEMGPALFSDTYVSDVPTEPSKDLQPSHGFSPSKACSQYEILWACEQLVGMKKMCDRLCEMLREVGNWVQGAGGGKNAGVPWHGPPVSPQVPVDQGFTPEVGPDPGNRNPGHVAVHHKGNAGGKFGPGPPTGPHLHACWERDVGPADNYVMEAHRPDQVVGISLGAKPSPRLKRGGSVGAHQVSSLLEDTIILLSSPCGNTSSPGNHRALACREGLEQGGEDTSCHQRGWSKCVVDKVQASGTSGELCRGVLEADRKLPMERGVMADPPSRLPSLEGDPRAEMDQQIHQMVLEDDRLWRAKQGGGEIVLGLEADIKQLTGVLRTRQEEVRAVSQELESLSCLKQHELSEVSRAKQDMAEITGELSREVARLEVQRMKLREAIEGAEVESNEKLQELSQLKSQLLEVCNARREAEEAVRHLHSELSILQQQKQELEAAMGAVQDELHALNQQQKDIQCSIAHGKQGEAAVVDDLWLEIARLSAQVKEGVEKLQSLSTDLHMERTRVCQLKAENEELVEELVHLQRSCGIVAGPMEYGVQELDEVWRGCLEEGEANVGTGEGGPEDGLGGALRATVSWDGDQATSKGSMLFDRLVVDHREGGEDPLLQVDRDTWGQLLGLEPSGSCASAGGAPTPCSWEQLVQENEQLRQQVQAMSRDLAIAHDHLLRLGGHHGGLGDHLTGGECEGGEDCAILEPPGTCRHPPEATAPTECTTFVEPVAVDGGWGASDNLVATRCAQLEEEVEALKEALALKEQQQVAMQKLVKELEAQIQEGDMMSELQLENLRLKRCLSVLMDFLKKQKRNTEEVHPLFEGEDPGRRMDENLEEEPVP